jgi:hypothetical protein
MTAQASIRAASDHPVRLVAMAVVAVALAAGQGGCCCFECVEHCTAPLHYIPPVSALTPRNPPCSYVDPMCYGYHGTCWRSWPVECDNARDCLQWCQQDALPLPAKGESAPPLAPMPLPMQEQPPAPAPAENSSLQEPVRIRSYDAETAVSGDGGVAASRQPVRIHAYDAGAEQPAEPTAPAPIIHSSDLPVSARLEAALRQTRRSARSPSEQPTSTELP